MRLIDADNLNCETLPKKLYPHLQAILDFMDAQTTVEERKVGKWEYNAYKDKSGGHCNRCGHFLRYGEKTNFCPDCGAEMRGSENG